MGQNTLKILNKVLTIKSFTFNCLPIKFWTA